MRNKNIVPTQEIRRMALLCLSLFCAYGAFLAADVGRVRTAFFMPTVQNLAQTIGVSAAVPENEYNSLAQQLAAKDAELAQREKVLLDREEGTSGNQISSVAVWLMAGSSLILLLLILLNYYTDWRRAQTYTP